jgi:FkbM family methyltransferase
LPSLSDILRLAQAHMTRGDWRAAADIYLQILDRHPAHPEALMGRLRAGLAGRDMGAVADAQARLEQVYGSAGAAADLALAQARLQDALRVLGEAAAAARRAADLDPSLPEIEYVQWAIGHHLGHYPQCFSQFGQDHYLDRHVFAGKRGGVFVDVGAYDGFTGSNTAFFEIFRGWSGLCIEPDAAQFAALALSRRVPSVQTCIGARNGSDKFLSVSEGLTMMGGLVENYDPAAMKMVTERSATQVMEVPVRRLDEILSEHAIAAVDYLSLDTEGSELAILKSFDLSRFAVKALSVENNRNTPEIEDHLKANGYRRLTRLGVDDIYVPAP